MRDLVVIFFLFFCHCVFAQDSLHIYFNTGSSKIRPHYDSKLSDFTAGYDLNLAESIEIIGFADSTGKEEANKRLSLRRAEQVYKKVRKDLPENIPVTILAKGEGVRSVDSLNRRVDIIVHFLPKNDPREIDIVSRESECFAVDEYAMQIIHSRLIKEGKREVVLIETEDFSYFTNNRLYVVKEVESTGKAVLQRVKWTKKKTGYLWWKKNRLVANVPKYGFERFSLFEVYKDPCTYCSEKILDQDTFLLTTPLLRSDVFLMQNMLAKAPLFRKRPAKIKVPAEYVDLATVYYADSDPITWETKRGRKNKDCYIANIRLRSDSYLPEIVKSGFTSTECITADTNSYRRFRPCGGFGEWKSRFRIVVEPGAFYHNDSLTAFLTLGVVRYGPRVVTSLQAGINSHSGAYGFFRSQYYFLPFSSRNLKFSSWSGYSAGALVNQYMSFVTGFEFKTSYNKGFQSFFEGNVHLGISKVNTVSGTYFPQLYLYGGLAYDFSGHINSEPYGFIQLGMTIDIGNLYKKLIRKN